MRLYLLLIVGSSFRCASEFWRKSQVEFQLFTEVLFLSHHFHREAPFLMELLHHSNSGHRLN